MDEEFIKKLASALGVDPSKLSGEQLKSAADLFSSQPEQQSSVLDPETKAAVNTKIRDSLVSDPQTEQMKKMDLAERMVANQMSPERDVVADSRGSYKNDLRKLQRERTAEEAAARKDIYGKMGLEIPKTLPGADQPDALRDDRLPGMEERNKPARAEAERRGDIRSGAALDIQKNLKEGRTDRDIFGGSDGSIVGPAQLQKELIAGGMDRNDANIAAGQRYRDMFDLPNAKGQGFGMRGGQRDAVLNAAPEDRMTIMEGLRNARRDNLQELARQRRENPRAAGFSGGAVGTVTEIAAADGRVLAKRTPEGGGAVVANGRTGTPGALELTDAGERAIRDRTYSKTFTPAEMGSVSDVNGQKGYSGRSGEIRGVTGKHGSAIGGMNVGDTLRAKGLTQGTPEWDEARADLLANAGNAARSGGQVDSVAGALTSRMPSGSAEAIDQKWNNYERGQKVAAENKLGNDFLNAYNQAGGKTSPVKPDAKSPGPRTDAEKGAMQGFVNKAPGEQSEIVKGLTAPAAAPAKTGESEEAKRRRLLAAGRPR